MSDGTVRYDSRDFHIGVASFMEKREPRWTGK